MKLDPADSSNETAQRIAGTLMFWQALCGLVLFAATWRLWWPASDFPRIPWFGWGLSVPIWVDAAACVVLAGSLGALCLSLSPTMGFEFNSHTVVGERAGVRGQPDAVTSGRRIRFPQRLGRSLALPCVLVSLGLLVSLDQHRLQPWVWQMLLWCVVFLATPTTMLRCLRWLTVSIYFWSGVSKLDAAFTQPDSHGWLLVEGLTRALGIDTRFWQPETMSNLARIFPWGELLLAVWLSGWMLIAFTRSRYKSSPLPPGEGSGVRGFPRFTRPSPCPLLPGEGSETASTDRAQPAQSVRWPSRMLRAGCWGAIAMHLVLMLIVGPLGLNHEPGVLVWNVFFIGQAWLLFGRKDVVAVQAARREQRTMGDRIITAFTLAAMIFPLLSFRGWCDHWPAWSVYSSRPAIVEVWIDTDAAQDLPSELQSFLAPAPPLETQREFNLDAWSYRELGCPLYPQDRYRLALVREFIARHDLTDDAMIRIQSSPDWRTGERQVEELAGADLDSRLSGYAWNTQAR